MGDAVLVRVAHHLVETLPADSLASRWDGEEFCLLYRRTSATDAAESLQQSMAKLQNLPLSEEADELRISFTAGVTEWRPGDSVDDVLRHADTALYKGKNAGRARVIVSDPESD